MALAPGTTGAVAGGGWRAHGARTGPGPAPRGLCLFHPRRARPPPVSSELPRRPRGVTAALRSTHDATAGSSAAAAATDSVAWAPGTMQFARIPCGASSSAIDRVRWMTAALAAP